LTAEVLSFEGGARPGARRPIDLADVQPFQLGSLSVEPGMREITSADGSRQVLEPRVMQVLVALARAQGAIVSRDELIRTCWNGTVVGDDAINRPISLLRRLSEKIGDSAFRIETIPRVGYRLLAGSDSRQAQPSAAARGVRNAKLWATLAVLLVMAVGLTAWPATPQGPTYSISLQPFRTPAAAIGFNDQLSSELTSLDVPTVGGRSALTLTGSVDEDGTVNARLLMPGGRAVLWSGAITQLTAAEPKFAGTAEILGSIAQCALAGANDAGSLPPELLSLYVRTCELGARGQNALGVKVARELTRQAPDFAAGWFALSHHALTLYDSAPRLNAPLREESLAAAAKLVALRPDAQDGYVSEALALDPRQRVERERFLRHAIGLESIYVDRAQAGLSDLLLEVGRAEEAFQLDRLGAQQNPEQPGAQARLFLSASATGRWTLADRALEKVKALDPAKAPALLWRKAVWRGDWEDAERRLPPRDPVVDRAAVATYRALASGDAIEKDAAARQVEQLPDDCCVVMQAELLTELGRHPEVIAQLEGLETARPSSLNLAVFLANPAARSLWHDPAIAPLLKRIGLIDYWRASGSRPDVCKAPSAPAFCRLLVN
jgi:DNA-binding winged helix-turn-helix (wHTH) protein